MARGVRETSRLRSFASACLLTMLPATVAWAGIDPTPFRTGLFGLTPTQSIRISVVNTGDVRGIITPRVIIRDVAGSPVAERRARPLAEGIGTFVDFTGAVTVAGANVAGPSRTQVRAEVSADYLPLGDDGRVVADDEAAVRALRRNVRLTLEIFETATGRTAFTVPFDAVGFDPQPDPPRPADAQ